MEGEQSPLERGQRVYEHGNWQEAIDDFARAPDNAQSAYWMSQAKWQFARDLLPDPLQPQAGSVKRYIAAIQAAERAITHALSFQEMPGIDIPRDLLEKQLRAIRKAVKDQLRFAQARLLGDRSATLSLFDHLFGIGGLPSPPLDGRYTGLYLDLALAPGLTELGNVARRLWMPWKGKYIDAAGQCGVNIFDASLLPLVRLAWPGYSGIRREGQGTFRAFDFQTTISRSIADPESEVLQIDYNLAENPAFLVRDVRDELVQLVDGLYFGKSYLLPGGIRFLAAYFALERPEA